MPDELPLFPEPPRTQGLQQAGVGEVETAILAAIRAGAAGGLPRSGDLLLAGLCARVIADRLALAGFVIMRAE